MEPNDSAREHAHVFQLYQQLYAAYSATLVDAEGDEMSAAEVITGCTEFYAHMLAEVSLHLGENPEQLAARLEGLWDAVRVRATEHLINLRTP